MSTIRSSLLLAAVIAMTTAQLHAAVVLPVKAYTKPDEPIVVKFVNEKGEEGKKAVQELGAEAAKLDTLFTPAPAADISYKIFSADGSEVKVAPAKPGDDGIVDLSAVCPQLKDGGTFYLVWKDAPPLVIETLYNPDRGPDQLARFKAQIEQLAPDQKKMALAQYGPTVTHLEIAQYAVITTDQGVIKAKFSYEAAPHTIDNFISLARQNFYDNSAFHRIISGFMLQGGDSYANTDGAGTGGPGYEIMHEFSGKKRERGTLSMARSSSADSAGSQFFIMHAKTPNLDNQYAAFGDVFEGLDVVDAIAKTPSEKESGAVRGPKPKIISIRILPATAEIYGLKK